jgi:dienelactone hydrolase
MAGSRKESWQYLPDILQNLGEGSRAYAVFAFDFRGHGESQGSKDDLPGMVEDARAALSTFRTLAGVDPGRIVLMGASVGADAAVDACSEPCVGAISLSPGNYLGIEYASALSAMGAKPVLCVASESDGQPVQTCRNGEQLGLTDYQIQIYKGGFHGTEMLGITDQQPPLTDLIVKWLGEHVP